MKNEKGITLIALIITIIVMLILVGVTINVALNGGLFNKAKTASEQTQRETDKEQLLSAVIGTLNNDGTVNEEELQSHLPDNFKYENGVYKNKVTGKEYTVDSKTGKVTEVASTNSGNSGNTEATEETHTFKLGDLPTEGMEVSGDGPKFNLNSVKQVLGEDLFSDNSKYLLKQGNYGALALEINNEELIDQVAVAYNLASANPNVKYYVTASINFTDNEFQFIVKDKDNYDTIVTNPTTENRYTWSQFVALYPDTVFTVLDVSNISI